jgi:hypothetical protein
VQDVAVSRDRIKGLKNGSEGKMQKRNDKWMRIIGVPLLALTGQWAMYGYTNVPTRTTGEFRFSLFSAAYWSGRPNRRGIILSRRKYRDLTQTRHRVFYQLIWFVFFCQPHPDYPNFFLRTHQTSGNRGLPTVQTVFLQYARCQ